MSTPSQTILVTGANKGIGLEVCRQLAQAGHHVILSARSMERGQAAVALLAKEGLKVDFLRIDTSSEESILAGAKELGQRIKALHVLINNAAVLTTWQGTILDATAAELRETLVTNTIGPVLLIQALLPLLEAGRPARVINVTSQLGSVADMTDGWAGYGISKAALNAATRKLAQALKPRGISVIAASPGWVRTDMGGESAPLSLEEGGKNIARWVAEMSPGMTDQFIGSNGPIAW